MGKNGRFFLEGVDERLDDGPPLVYRPRVHISASSAASLEANESLDTPTYSSSITPSLSIDEDTPPPPIPDAQTLFNSLPEAVQESIMIPHNFLCAISAQLMSTPVCIVSHPSILMDFDILKYHFPNEIDENIFALAYHPVNREHIPAKESKIIQNKFLKDKITKFIRNLEIEAADKASHTPPTCS